MIADYLRCDSNGCIPVAGLRCIRVSPRAAHLRILGGMRGFGLVSWGREFRKTGSLPDPSPREQHDGTAYPGRRFALPWAISLCPFGADVGGGAALVLAVRRLTHDGKEVPPSGRKRGPGDEHPIFLFRSHSGEHA